MKPEFASVRLWPGKILSSVERQMMGGNWAWNLAHQVRVNLAWYWLDGFFASACDNIVGTYLILYLLELGANRAQIGFMSSFSSLSAALLLIPGAVLVERFGRRKYIALFGGGMGRLAILLLALAPFFSGGIALVYLAMALSVTRDAMINLGYPAWMSITADVVPLEGRGRYFASRNFIMGIAAMAVTLSAGVIITHFSKAEQGYQGVLLAAFGLGLASTLFFWRIRDPGGEGMRASAPPLAFRALLLDVQQHPGFLWFAVTSALWNFSLNIAGPFFNVYMVQNLNASATMVALSSIGGSISALFVQRKLGELADRWGARRLQFVSSMLIPLIPLAWVFVRSAWQPTLINLIGGALWAGYNLASFNLLLSMIPPGQQPRYSAIYQVVVLLSLSAGAAVGGLAVTRWGYPAIFLASAVGRFAAALLFARLVRDFAHKLQPALE